MAAGPRPCELAEPAFAAPWEASAQALQQALIDRGVFSAAEWAEALGEEIAHAEQTGTSAGDGSDHYRFVVRALERLIVMRGVASEKRLDALQAAWREAAAATPHGQPIVLAPQALQALEPDQ